MLFSHLRVSATMDRGFECVWEQLRPAPRATIDFGDGHVLERTLKGNVATLFLTAEGRVYDVLPGIMEPEPYRIGLEEAAARHAALPPGGQGALQVQLDCVRRARELRESAAAAARVAGQEAYVQDFNLEIAKGAVELPIVEGTAASGPVATPEPEPEQPESGWFLGKGAVEDVILDATGRGLVDEPVIEDDVREVDDDIQEFDIEAGKFEVEGPVTGALLRRPTSLTPRDRENLAADTRAVFASGLPTALELLAGRPLCTPEELTTDLFRQVLHVDLDDPFLGLAPDVLGGRLGRYGPQGPDGPVPLRPEAPATR